MLDDRHVAPFLDGLTNTLAVAGGALCTPMEEPAAYGHDAERGIRGPRMAKLVRNCTRIPHAGRLFFDDHGPQPTLVTEGDRSDVTLVG
jgi:hypothetical protein